MEFTIQNHPPPPTPPPLGIRVVLFLLTVSILANHHRYVYSKAVIQSLFRITFSHEGVGTL